MLGLDLVGKRGKECLGLSDLLTLASVTVTEHFSPVSSDHVVKNVSGLPAVLNLVVQVLGKVVRKLQ